MKEVFNKINDATKAATAITYISSYVDKCLSPLNNSRYMLKTTVRLLRERNVK